MKIGRGLFEFSVKLLDFRLALIDSESTAGVAPRVLTKTGGICEVNTPEFEGARS